MNFIKTLFILCLNIIDFISISLKKFLFQISRPHLSRQSSKRLPKKLVIATGVMGDNFLFISEFSAIAKDPNIFLVIRHDQSALYEWMPHDRLILLNRSQFIINLFYRQAMIWKMKFYDDIYLTGSYSRPYAEATLARAAFGRIHNATLYTNLHEQLKIKNVSNYFHGQSEGRGRAVSLDVLTDFIQSGSIEIPDGKLLTISLGASDYKRSIDVEFINIALTKAPSHNFQNDCQVAIICTLKEKTDAYILQDKLQSIGYKDCAVHVAIPLQDVMHLISRSALFIGGDSGLSHFAVLSGIKSVIYAAGGHWGQFFPYPAGFSNVLTIGSEDKSCFGCNHKCKFSKVNNKFPCMLGYNPTSVERLIGKFLALKKT